MNLRGYREDLLTAVSGILVKIYNALKVSSKRIGHSYGLKDLSSLQKGSRIGLQLSLYDGSLGFLVDGCHQGFAAKGVYDDRFDVYAVVEHTGGCCGTRITRSGVCIICMMW